MHAEFLAVMRHLETLEDVRSVVVTGTPPAFSVGGDSQALGDHAERGSYDTGLAEDTARPGGDLRKEFDEDLSWMFGYRLPIIAAVNGAVAGVSFALACFCDLRFGSAPAKITTAAPETRPACRIRLVVDSSTAHWHDPSRRFVALWSSCHGCRDCRLGFVERSASRRRSNLGRGDRIWTPSRLDDRAASRCTCKTATSRRRP